MNKSDLTILIVEDEVVVASDIRQILEKTGYTVTGLADRMEKAIALFTATRPYLVICDVRIKGATTGIQLIERLRKVYTNFGVIYLTAYSDEKTLHDALQTNPDSYLVKPFTDAQLKAAVSKAHHNASMRLSGDHDCPLSARELDVLGLLRRGLTSRDISALLSISIETVKSHRKNMLRKANVRNMTELIAFAVQNKWLDQAARF